MKTIITAIALSLASFSVQAASFDCSKASTKVEKLICSDSLVSNLDSSLNKVYNAIAQKPVEDQRAWIKNVRNKQVDVEGLAYVYASRIEELVNNEKYAYTVVDKAPEPKVAPKVEPKKEVKVAKSVVDNLKEHVAKGYIEAGGIKVSTEVLEKFGDTYLDRCNVKMAYKQFKKIEADVYRTAPMKDVAWLDANKEAVVIGMANVNTMLIETPEDEASFRNDCKALFEAEEAELAKEKENQRLTKEFFENAAKN